MKVPVLLLPIVTLCLVGCTSAHRAPPAAPTGTYAIEITGAEAATSGTLEIIGSPGAYWGRLTLHRETPYEIPVSSVGMHGSGFRYTLPDGHLTLQREGVAYVGDLVQSEETSHVRARKEGRVAEAFEALAGLSPFEWGLISTPENEAFPAFSSDGRTLYFSRFERWSHHTILVSEWTGGQWSAPATASFSGTYSDRAPFAAPDGSAILFTSNRPLSEEPERAGGGRYHLWMVERVGGGRWGAPRPLPYPVNSDSSDYHGALTRDGTVYFSSWQRPGGHGRSDLYRAATSGGSFQVQNLGPTINTAGSESDVYVDPDDRFIIFVSTDRPDGFGGDDLYISYRRNDTWTEPRNLGPPVNSYAFEYGPMISSDGTFLYFTSHRRGSADLYRASLNEVLNED